MSTESHKGSTGEEGAPLDLGTIRRQLGGKQGPELWRSLDELAAKVALESSAPS